VEEVEEVEEVLRALAAARRDLDWQHDQYQTEGYLPP
jgi:hypothetical protein